MKKTWSNWAAAALTASKTVALTIALTLAIVSCGEKPVEAPVTEADPIGFERAQFIADTGKVRSGETFSNLLPRLGLTTQTTYELQRIAAETKAFDTRKIIAGNRVTTFYRRDTTGIANSAAIEEFTSQSAIKKYFLKRKGITAPEPEYITRRGALAYVVYDLDRVNSTIFACGGNASCGANSTQSGVTSDSCGTTPSRGTTLAVWNYAKPVEHQRRIADVTIKSSLWNDMIEADISPLLIVELADIYAWTVNFFGLQEGDRFRAIYNQSVCEGEIFNIDCVEFSIYDSGKTHLPAIRFDQQDGKNKYWNEKGESMRKAFLKAPLKYNRISSRFTYHRKHPVTGKVRPHTAVDYAAPSGTPVHTIGDGVVTQCGWDSSGGGNRIRIRHANGYETCYMHLRGFAKGIRAGARVAQGQTIGYVGSTGRSTGPHLDFRIWKDKKPLDPLKVISPPAKPLANENLDSLKVMYQRYLQEIGE